MLFLENPRLSKATLRKLEKQLNSFVALSSDELNPRDENRAGTLAGVRVGVKDIIDVAGMPTRNGSAACKDVEPVQTDAAVVAALRAAGARIVGKTTTTEFAFTDPTDCRNPYDLRRTPGGSSSGSGAAVAAGLVDVALGTQTAGSLCRPAAYCGVIGLKPSFGLLPTEGVTPLAPSFDSVGIIGRSIKNVRAALLAVCDLCAPSHIETARIGRLLLPTGQKAAPETLAAFEEASKMLARDHSGISDLALDIDVAAIVVAHRCVMLAEAGKAHGHLLDNDLTDQLRPNFRAALQAAATLSSEDLIDARKDLANAAETFWRQCAHIDVILTLPVPDGAPLMDGTTGFQDWLTPWTVFGGPLVCLPWGLDSLGRPRSVMIAGHPGADMLVLDIAERLEKLSPAMPRPDVLGC